MAIDAASKFCYRWQMNYFTALTFVLFSLSPKANAVTGAWQVWQAPGMLAEILLREGADITELRWEGKPLTSAELEREKSRCEMKVFRPALLQEPTKNSENRLRCTVVGKNKEEAVFEWDLSGSAFSGWGNRPSEKQCAPLERCTFQTLNEAINLRLFRAFQVSKDHPHVSTFTLCDPSGTICGTEYTLFEKGSDGFGKSYLTCIVDTEKESIYRTRCIFSYP